MSKSQNGQERRKYQRVLVEPSSKVLRVFLKDFGPSLVFDMSYSGAALTQPKERKVKDMSQTITLELVTEADQAEILAQPIRINDDVVAVNFQDISVKARIIIDRVVTDRIVGLNMKLVNPAHYNQNGDFSYWFHGPKETNLYLWAPGDRLERAQLDSAGVLVVYENESFTFENKRDEFRTYDLNNQQIALKCLAIVEQMNFETSPLAEFKKLVRDHVQN